MVRCFVSVLIWLGAFWCNSWDDEEEDDDEDEDEEESVGDSAVIQQEATKTEGSKPSQESLAPVSGSKHVDQKTGSLEDWIQTSAVAYDDDDEAFFAEAEKEASKERERRRCVCPRACHWRRHDIVQG